jgi:GTPase KRas protein
MAEYDPTIEDSYRTHIKSDYYNVMMEILDVAGQAEYRALLDHWFRTAEYYILVFDLTSRATFVDLSEWHDHILRVREDRKGMIVVGNKADLTNFIQVTHNEGHLWAKERGLSYMEISAKDRKSCTNVFMRVLDLDDTILQTPELWQTLAAGKSIIEKNKKCNIM